MRSAKEVLRDLEEAAAAARAVIDSPVSWEAQRRVRELGIEFAENYERVGLELRRQAAGALVDAGAVEPAGSPDGAELVQIVASASPAAQEALRQSPLVQKWLRKAGWDAQWAVETSRD